MMKILEAERWQKSANLHEVVLLQQDRQHHCTENEERELSGGEIARGGGPDADPSSERQRAPSKGPEGGRAQ